MPEVFGAEELSLLAAIHATPKDDSPRLRYAEWLQGQGAAEHAEFIRLQCQTPYVTIWYRDWEKPRIRDCPWDDDVARDRANRLATLLPTVYRTERYEHQRQSQYAEEHVRGLPLIEVGDETWPPPSPDNVLLGAGRLARIDLTVMVEQLAEWLSSEVMGRVDILRVDNFSDDGSSYDPTVWEAAIRQLAGWPELERLEYLNVHVYGGYMRPEESVSYHLAQSLLTPRVKVTYDH